MQEIEQTDLIPPPPCSDSDALHPNRTQEQLDAILASRVVPRTPCLTRQAKQIQTFKEAFNLIDQDSDGFISESDLKGLLSSLGQTPSPTTIRDLLSSSTTGEGSGPDGKLNFTTFVTLMSTHLSTLDPEPDLLEAFASFDTSNSGFVKVDVLREWLSSTGDRMCHEEIDRLLHPPFVDRQGNFNYRLFCSTLRVTDGEEDPAV